MSDPFWESQSVELSPRDRWKAKMHLNGVQLAKKSTPRQSFTSQV